MRFHSGWGVYYCWSWKHLRSMAGTCDLRFFHVFSMCYRAELPVDTTLAVDPLSWRPSVCWTCPSNVIVSAVYLCIDYIFCSLAVKPASVCICFIVLHFFFHSVPGTPSYEQSVVVSYSSSNLPTLNYCCGCDSMYKMLFTPWSYSLHCTNFHETWTRQNYIQFPFTQLTPRLTVSAASPGIKFMYFP